MSARVAVAVAVLLAGCASVDSSAPAGEAPRDAEAAILGLDWDTRRIAADRAALRLRFAEVPADAGCAASLRAEGRYGSGAPVYLWAAIDADDPPVSVLVQEAAEATAGGVVASQDLPRPPGGPWAAGFDGEVSAGTTWLVLASALGPAATKVRFSVACASPIPMPAIGFGTAEVVGLTAAGPQEGLGAGAGPVGASAGQRWAGAFASPEVHVRVVQPSPAQLAEAGEVVLGHPGGEETVAFPLGSLAHRLDGPAGSYSVRVDHVQAGSYLGAVLLAGTSPVADLASAGVSVQPSDRVA